MTTVPDDLKPILADWLLSMADDKLMLGHRNSDWTGIAPFLEEDLAFSSIAQDEIAHAHALYGLAGDLLSRSADQLAYGRNADEYRCAHLVERSDKFDYARALVRQFFYDLFDSLRLPMVANSSFTSLAELAGKMASEERFHLEHLSGWVRRLGRANDESRGRMQEAVNILWPDALMLFEPIADQDRIREAGYCPADCAALADQWRARAEEILCDSELTVPKSSASNEEGGRRGRHTDEFKELLAELTEVYGTEPDAVW
jgi:ring-1,2-phenylacetyl-CoA epoxidase subunit PaaC